MQAVDHIVVSRIADWLEQGQSCWLATVVATYGSSPRPVGSMLACDSNGTVEGSLSGGCVEENLVDKLQSGALAQEGCQFLRYGESPEEAEKFGLPCGGHLDIVVEALLPSSANRSSFRRIRDRLDARQQIKRVVNLSLSESQVVEVTAFEQLDYRPEQHVLAQVYGPRYQLMLIGAGLLSLYVAEFAQALDFEIAVCDPREELLGSFRVPNVRRVQDMPDDAVRNFANDRLSAIVALTHDPRIDDMGMMEALETDAFYIGALGSKRTSDKRRERLRELGVNDKALARLHAPIGLSIGSKTPPEIAISILAEIIAERKKLEAQEAECLQPQRSAPMAAEAT